MTAEPSMKDMFGDDSDNEESTADAAAIATQRSASTEETQPGAADQPSMTDLFGSDDEDGDDDSSLASADDPYRSGSQRTMTDFEQQLAGLEDDGEVDEDTSRPTSPSKSLSQPEAMDSELTVQQQREVALAKRKSRVRNEDDDAQLLADDEPSRQQFEEAEDEDREIRRESSQQSKSTAAVRSAKPIPASGPTLRLKSLKIPAYPLADASNEIHLVRLPNVIGVHSQPFDPVTYVEAMIANADDEKAVGQGSFLEKRERMKAVNAIVENMIRWRAVTDSNGAIIKESNARFVDWSDGTSSLLIGKEQFDVVQSKIDGHKNFLYLQCSAQNASTDDVEDASEMVDDDAENDSGIAHHKSLQYYRSLGSFIGHIKFRVSGIESASHQKLKEVVFEQLNKKSKIVMQYDEVNPEKERQEIEKLAKKRSTRRERSEGERSTRRPRATMGTDFDRDFLEGDDDEEGEEEITERKSRPRRKTFEDEERNARRLNRAKKGKRKQESEEEDEEEAVEEAEEETGEEEEADAEEAEAGEVEEEPQEEEEDDEEIDVVEAERRARRQRARQAMMSAENDDDDDDASASGGATKKRRVVADDETED